MDLNHIFRHGFNCFNFNNVKDLVMRREVIIYNNPAFSCVILDVNNG
jgi:hypothetical protein